MNYINNSIIKEYIDNEIDYIENGVDYRDKMANEDSYDENLNYLKSLNKKDIQEITNKINNDDELQETINDLINYWVYHKRLD